MNPPQIIWQGIKPSVLRNIYLAHDGGFLLGKNRETVRKIAKGKRAVIGIAAVVLILCVIIMLLVFGGAGAVTLFSEDEEKVQTAAEAAKSSSANRQVILSMGEEEDEVYISWKGDEAGPRLLRYAGDKYSLPVQVPVRAQRIKILKGDYYRFKVKLTGVKPGKTYYYEIGDGTVYDSPRFFSAPDKDGEDVFAYLGDPQFDKTAADYGPWGRLTYNMYAANTDLEFVLMGGDMVNIPTREDHWDGFLDNSGLFSMVPLMTIPGNHEGVVSNNTYKKLFHHINNGPEGEAFYWFESENCRFIMLDSSFLTKARKLAMGKESWADKKEEVDKWLRETLEDSQKTWNIVVVHHPVYGLHDVFTVSPEIREEWLPIMKEEGVNLVLCGHQHVYMRTRALDGIVHIMGVSGAKRSNYYRGMNAPAYSEAIYASGPNYQIIRATEKELEIVSYNEKGSIIDAARIGNNFKLPYSRIF